MSGTLSMLEIFGLAAPAGAPAGSVHKCFEAEIKEDGVFRPLAENTDLRSGECLRLRPKGWIVINQKGNLTFAYYADEDAKAKVDNVLEDWPDAVAECKSPLADFAAPKSDDRPLQNYARDKTGESIKAFEPLLGFVNDGPRQRLAAGLAPAVAVVMAATSGVAHLQLLDDVFTVRAYRQARLTGPVVSEVTFPAAQLTPGIWRMELSWIGAAEPEAAQFEVVRDAPEDDRSASALDRLDRTLALMDQDDGVWRLEALRRLKALEAETPLATLLAASALRAGPKKGRGTRKWI